MNYILVFVVGLIYEGASVFWVHNSERENAKHTAFFSMVKSTCAVIGFTVAVRDWHYAPLFILGYGVGGYLGVIISKRKS